MYGRITPEMESLIRTIVQDRVVWALGSGPTLDEAKLIIQWGAKKVFAIDRHDRSNMILPAFTDRGRIIQCQAYYTEFLTHVATTKIPKPDVVFIKWPDTGPNTGQIALAHVAPIVIYIGSNDRMSACGNDALWAYFRYRPVNHTLDAFENSMIVYGEPCDTPSPHPRCREEELRSDSCG